MAKKKTGKELSRQFRKDYKKTNEKLEKLIAGELAPTETNPIVPFKRIPDKEIIKSFTRQSKVAKAKKGTEGPLKKSIRILMDEMDSYELGELLDKFKDTEKINDLFESLYEPRIDIHNIEVYETPDTKGEKEYISYAVRDRWGTRTTKFTTIQNHMLKIRKKLHNHPKDT